MTFLNMECTPRLNQRPTEVKDLMREVGSVLLIGNLHLHVSRSRPSLAAWINPG